ncbi:hypothetical protein O181_094515 [Austropuccinia psidii MF-1]|uniref:Uncharacterized protein n=1 Tax=Austropuccinia psidii MF-1 TaxID=1389203 RepID=A0A9Q3J3U7_9BASI|nr:hypothetical protein [Austropuccinia psidii MF-1]
MSSSDHSYGSGYSELIKDFTASEIEELLFGSTLPSFAETLSDHTYPPQLPPALAPLSRAPSVTSDAEGRGAAAFPERQHQSPTIYVPKILRDRPSPRIGPTSRERMSVSHVH